MLSTEPISVHDINGLSTHYFQAGEVGSPLVVLISGLSKLAYGLRSLTIPIKNLGFFVVAPDQRGYGKTSLRFVMILVFLNLV